MGIVQENRIGYMSSNPGLYCKICDILKLTDV